MGEVSHEAEQGDLTGGVFDQQQVAFCDGTVLSIILCRPPKAS